MARTGNEREPCDGFPLVDKQSSWLDKDPLPSHLPPGQVSKMDLKSEKHRHFPRSNYNSKRRPVKTYSSLAFGLISMSLEKLHK